MTKETEHKRIITERFGRQCDSDSSFTRKARLLQSIYRVEMGEKEGTGPTKNSHRYYGNMICGGDVSGANFLMPETFEYAKERVSHKKSHETIDGFRLFNNLLSSMRMAFNLFYPLILLLKQDGGKVTLAIQSAFKNLPISKVTDIGLEFIPTPIEKYTKDKSAMDAYVKFIDHEGGLNIIAIETKYTDTLGINEARHCEEQKQLLIDTRLFKDEFSGLLKEGKIKLTQIYRNILLTERYRMVEGLHDSYSIVLSPKDHPSTSREITSVTDYLKPEYAYKLASVTLEDFTDAMIQYLPDRYIAVYERFRDRYLNFEKIRSYI